MAFTYGSLGYAKDSNGTTIAYNGTNVYQIRLGYQVNSQDIEQNKSNITLQLEIRSINSQYKTYGYNQTTTIDGTTLSAKTFDFRSTNTWQIFGTRTFDVSHNSDGTYSANKSGSFTTTATGTGRPHSGSASVTVALPTIPRASQITVNDANIGSSTNIVINKANSNFTTTLWYKASGQSSWTKIVDKTSNQVYGWTVPTSFYSLIPSSKTISCQFYADTYNGSTLIGTSNTITATFTATGNPVINSSSATDVNSTTTALTGNSANMVKYASNVQVSINVSGQNSATISSVTVNGSSVSLSGTNPKTGSITFNGATTNTFTIVATDTRGYQTTTTKTMTMVNYVPLSINQNIKRNQPTDEKVNVSLSGNYFNASFGSQSNTLTVQYRYKESTSSSWGSWTTVNNTKSGNTYTASTQLSGMTYTNSYNFEVRATDKVGTKTITGITVTKGQPVYWWNDSGLYVNGDLKKNGTSVATGTINNATLTIQKNGSTVKTFTANASSNVTANITVPTNTNELTNGAGFITSSSLPSATTGTVTCTKSSGNSTIQTATYYQYGKVITIFIKLKTSGSTSVGSNIWSGKISNVTLPKTRVTGAGYYASGIAMAGIYGTTEGSDSGRMDIRALGAAFANNQEIYFSVTYVTNN